MKNPVVSPLSVVSCNDDKMNRKVAENAKFSLGFSCFLSDLGALAVKNNVRLRNNTQAGDYQKSGRV